MGLRIILIFVVVMLVFQWSGVQAEINLPQTIRVGLKFGSTAPAAVSIGSPGGHP